jgi:hypothetical protein
MSVESLKAIQQKLKDAGFYTGKIDGIWGSGSQAALDASIAAGKKCAETDGGLDIAWSAKVSPAFSARVKTMVEQLKMPPEGADWLMACMAFESGETFSPSIKNGAGAPYYGLIQFGEAAAKDCGTTVADLIKMTAEQQLEYVYLYFKPLAGKLLSVADLYMKILWPIAVGKPDSYVLWDSVSRPTTYSQNKGLDVNKDGQITKGEAASKVVDKLKRGLLPENRRKL